MLKDGARGHIDSEQHRTSRKGERPVGLNGQVARHRHGRVDALGDVVARACDRARGSLDRQASGYSPRRHLLVGVLWSSTDVFYWVLSSHQHNLEYLLDAHAAPAGQIHRGRHRRVFDKSMFEEVARRRVREAGQAGQDGEGAKLEGGAERRSGKKGG